MEILKTDIPLQKKKKLNKAALHHLRQATDINDYVVRLLAELNTMVTEREHMLRFGSGR